MNDMASPLAGKPTTQVPLLDVDKLVAEYFDLHPDPAVAGQRVSFGTSGHRGSAFHRSFNEWHILAIAQAICDYRKSRGIRGPLYLGRDPHALSAPAAKSALEVLAGNDVETRISRGCEFTPTPVVSHAIVTHNGEGHDELADGIIVTPSHNPPDNGGIKYNPPHGGPAETAVTDWIERRANALLSERLKGVRRMSLSRQKRAPALREFDFLDQYVTDLGTVIDFDVIRSAGVHMGVDPLGGAGVEYWGPIAERYQIDLSVVSNVVDPTFSFMTLDMDGAIRMDPSSPWAMQRLIARKDDYDVAWACDTDHDRHGIVVPGAGLLEPNHYLSVLTDYLFRERSSWRHSAAIGKSIVTTSLLDRVARRLGRGVYEVPVGFKWFVDGLSHRNLGCACEESAGATFLSRDGTVWTTDKDGIVAGLLAAEMTARSGRDPGVLYRALTRDLGNPVSARLSAPVTLQQKVRLAMLDPERIAGVDLAGEKIEEILDKAPGNGAYIEGVKVVTANGWFAVRPSGTEDIYKLYAESFNGPRHLHHLMTDAKALVDDVLAAPDEKVRIRQ